MCQKILLFSDWYDQYFLISPNSPIYYSQVKDVHTLVSSFCSIEEIILQEARRAPITFLYATERRFLSSTVSSLSETLREATFFIASTISEKKKDLNVKSLSYIIA